MGSQSGQVRIIAGAWRRRRLSVAARPGVRPTPDAVRETLFNWLATEVQGANCLDLFAGSGALGFEAASRGAERITMVDVDRHTIATLRDNASRLDAAAVIIKQHDAVRFLKQSPTAKNNTPFDIVFLDPPFYQGLVQPCIELLCDNPAWLAPDAWVYIEQAHTDSSIDVPANWQEHRYKRCGSSDIHLFAKHPAIK